MNKTLISTMMICGAGFAFSDNEVVEVTGDIKETMSLTVFEAETHVIESDGFMKKIADFKLEKGFCRQIEWVDLGDDRLSVNMNITVDADLSLSFAESTEETFVATVGAVLEDDVSISVEDIRAICLPDSGDGDSGDGDNSGRSAAY